MTFLEAALEILKRERKALHYKELTERALDRKLLTFVGRTPEVTMQTQLTAAVKKAPGNPFVRVKPGVFGLLRYPTAPPPEPATEERKAETEAGDAGEARDGRRRRRRGGRGRRRGGERAGALGAEAARSGGEMTSDDTPPGDADDDRDLADTEEPELSGALSAEDRAAALAESGVLGAESDDDADAGDHDADEGEAEQALSGAADSDEEEAEPEEEEEEGVAEAGAAVGAEEDEGDAFEEEGEEEVAADAERGPEELGAGRRRRRRRRRRRGENGLPELGGAEGPRTGDRPAEPLAAAPVEGGVAPAPAVEAAATDAQAGRRIMSPVDAAIEILKGQTPGRGVHVRQIADAAVRRRLVHGEPNEAWRVMRAALAAEPRERLRSGQRPRIRAAGSGLFALSRRPPDMDLERSEHVFSEARRALRERTLASLEQRLGELGPSAFEAIARVLLQREGFGPATFVKRVEGTVYLEALRGRGSRPSRCLVALRPTSTPAGRRSIGELRAGIRARNQDEGVLMLAGRLAEEAIAEWRQPGPPIEVVDGPALAETCMRHGVGVVSAVVNVDFVDADFFAEISEG